MNNIPQQGRMRTTFYGTQKQKAACDMQRRYSRDFSVGVQSTSANLELRGFICMIAA
jgi:hypothetical protein